MDNIISLILFITLLNLILTLNFKYNIKNIIFKLKTMIVIKEEVKPKRKTRNTLQTKSEYVYFIIAPEVKRIKIGITTLSPKERLSKLDTGSPCYLYVLGFIRTNNSKELEKELHDKFTYLKYKKEWFTINPELINYIKLNSEEYIEHLVK